MTSLSMPALRCGSPTNLPHSTPLQAGPLSMLLEQGELRRIRSGSHELVRRIYTSLRGPDWATIPAKLVGLKVEAEADSFRVSYSLVHQKDDFDFTWAVTLEGTAQGKLYFEARGSAAKAFATNRASICLLHPLTECVGRRVRVKAAARAAGAASFSGATEVANSEGVESHWREGFFPNAVIPQQAFIDFQTFEYEIANGIWASLKYSGEDFEMEDQRNWSDGSFKTYSPLQSKPKPRQVEAGWETVQSVTFEILQPTAWRPPVLNPTVNLEVNPTFRMDPDSISGPSSHPPLPQIGFGMASHGKGLESGDIHRLKNLAPKHLRANFFLGKPGILETLARSALESRQLAVPIEAAVFLPALEKNGVQVSTQASIQPLVGHQVKSHSTSVSLDTVLDEFAKAWQDLGATAIRWLVFIQNQDSVPEAILDQVKKHLGPLNPKAPFVIGSRDDFVLLNRHRPSLPGSQAQGHPQPSSPQPELCFVMTPQVHLFDNRTLVESLQGQEWVLRTVGETWPDRRINVTPITLKRTPLAMALKKNLAVLPEEIWKSQVEARQFSLLGACWTLATLKNLVLATSTARLDLGLGLGLNATFFETTGLLGLMSGEGLDSESLTVPGTDFKLDSTWVFPLYHVFADYAEFAQSEGVQIQDWISDSPLRITGFALNHGNRRTLLLANLEEKPANVCIKSVGIIKGIRRLNEQNAMFAMRQPEAYRNAPLEPASPTATGSLNLEMLPFEFIRLDLEGESKNAAKGREV